MISFIAVFATGFIMFFIRFFDPFYNFLIKQTFNELFGFVKDEPKEGI